MKAFCPPPHVAKGPELKPGLGERRTRVLYFTVIPMATDGNGGSICCRNHVARLASDPGIELFVVAAAPPDAKSGTDDFFSSLGIHYVFQPLLRNNFYHSANSLRAIVDFAFRSVFQFYWELKAFNQPHIQQCLDWAIQEFDIEVLLIEYLPSALCITLPRHDIRTALIKQNREGDFYDDLIKMGKTHHGSLTAAVSLWRARRFEERTESSVDKVIAIGPPDLPTHRLRTESACISPYLDRKKDNWKYGGSKIVLFIGDIGHYPNEMAVRWIAERLAPELQRLGSDAIIAIVGAAQGEIPPGWEGPNVRFMGKSSDEELKTLFLTSDLMLCPIENDYGVKFKSLEALSYGIPLLASKQTLLGLPYLASRPCIDLANVTDAANTICSLLENPGLLQELSLSQAASQGSFIALQEKIWSRTLANVPSSKANQRARLR